LKIAKSKKPKDKPKTVEQEDVSTSGVKLHDILKRRRELDEQLRSLAAQEKKIQKILTVMFTDLKGSTDIADRKGSFEVRLLIDYHNDIVFPLIENGNGRLIKTMGDGTMSYFLRAQDAVCTAVKIQQEISEFNQTGKSDIPILMRIGIHTAKGIVDEDKEKGRIDIFGDVANVASRIEGLAVSSEVLFSEGTFNALRDKEEVYCCYQKTSELKGKADKFKIFKAFWDEKEIEEEKKKGEIPVPITIEESKKPPMTNRMDVVHEGYSHTQTPAEVAAEAVKAGHAPCLVVQREDDDKLTVPIDKDELTMGRSSDCDIVLDERYISRKHARVCREQGTYWAEDLKSSIGISVNGKRISKEQLQNGDEIKFGAIRIIFADAEAVSSEEATMMDVTMAVPTLDDEPTMSIDTQPIYKLVVSDADGAITEHEISPDGIVLGRSTASDVLLKDPMVSRRHANVFTEADSFFVEDLGSNNGTFVDKKRIQPGQKVELKEKQLITIGEIKLMVVNAAVNAEKSLFADASSSFSKGLGKLWGRGQK